jgi:hypothetical protein
MSLLPVTERPRQLEAMSRRAARVRRVNPVRPAHGGQTRVRLWLPLTPLFWILAPFAILLAPLILLAPPLWRMNPYETAYAVGRLLLALGGTDIDVDTPEARVRIKIL